MSAIMVELVFNKGIGYWSRLGSDSTIEGGKALGIGGSLIN